MSITEFCEPTGAVPSESDVSTAASGTTATATGVCRGCNTRIVARRAEVISGHRTSEGLVSYVRCPCGRVGFIIEPLD